MAKDRGKKKAPAQPAQGKTETAASLEAERDAIYAAQAERGQETLEESRRLPEISQALQALALEAGK
jgi:hypothetical protein